MVMLHWPLETKIVGYISTACFGRRSVRIGKLCALMINLHECRIVETNIRIVFIDRTCALGTAENIREA